MAPHLNSERLVMMRTVQQITVEEIDAAARVLDKGARFYGWWPETAKPYDDLDPIGKDEFRGLVARVLLPAERARSAGSSDQRQD
jgi:hypothetical protein